MVKNKLKIIQLTPYYYPSIGGVENVCQYLSEELSFRGHKVEVFTSKRNHKGLSSENFNNFEIINSVDIYRFNSLLNIGHMSFCPKISEKLHNSEVDIIHSHVYRHPHLQQAIKIGAKRNIPIVLHGHSPFIESNYISKTRDLLYKTYDLIAKHTILKKITWFIALTEFEKIKYMELGIDPSKITVIPNAAAKEFFETSNTLESKKKLGLADKKVILFVGNINPIKRVDLIIKALPEIIKYIPNIFLLLVGPDEGSLSSNLQLAENLQVNKYIKWLGPLYDRKKLEAFSSCDILSLTSDLDALPLVMFEAMALGKPVISTKTIGPSTIIKDNFNGILINKGDYKELADRIVYLLQNDKLYQDISINAKNTAIEQNTVQGVTDKVENIYKRILNEKS